MFKKIIEKITHAVGLSEKKIMYKDDDYATGQVWQYHTREGEENSTVQIIGINKYPNEETIIHISVKGLKMKNPMIENGVSEEIGHMPFSKSAFSESVTSLLGISEVSEDAKESQKQWQLDYEKGGGGMFTVSIPELIEGIERGMNTEI